MVWCHVYRLVKECLAPEEIWDKVVSEKTEHQSVIGKIKEYQGASGAGAEQEKECGKGAGA